MIREPSFKYAVLIFLLQTAAAMIEGLNQARSVSLERQLGSCSATPGYNERCETEPLNFSSASILTYSANDVRTKSTWYSGVAKAYQEHRPLYSDDIVSYMVQRCTNLKATDVILEIGSGPGTATASFAGLVKHMTCLEPNADFCEMARRSVGLEFPNVNIIRSSFEEYSTDAQFDAILAASSIHWIDPDVAPVKCASLLKDGGSLLLLWNNIVQPSEQVTLALRTIYNQYAPHLYEPYKTPGVARLDLIRDIGNRVAGNVAFENLQFGYTIESAELTALQYCQTLSTYSPYFLLETKDELFRDITQFIDTHLDGRITLTYEAAFHTATKVIAPENENES